MHYLRPELLPVIDTTPEQTTWDVDRLREEGDRLFLAPADQTVRVEGHARIFEPESVDKTTSLILSIHGGGYVSGRAQFDDARNRELCKELGVIVVSPDYRLAPESPYPLPVSDCLNVAQNYSRDSVFILGDSAGGGLAYSCTARLVEQHTPPRGMILLEPALDPSVSTRSMDTFAAGPVWTKKAAEAAWGHYRPTPNAFPHPTSEFPPSLIVVNPVDPLRDEGIGLATALVDAGAPSELHMFPGTFHGALSVPGSVPWAEIKALMRRFISENA